MSPRRSKGLTLTQADAAFFDYFCCSSPVDRWHREEIRASLLYPDGVIDSPPLPAEIYSHPDPYKRNYLSPSVIAKHRRWDIRVSVWGGEYTRCAIVDIDNHQPDNPDCVWLFYLQCVVVVRHFLARGGTAHVQIPLGPMTGIHILWVFEQPRRLDEVRAEIKAELRSLAEQHPDLEAMAKGLNQRTLANLEIYPDRSHLFRLPGGHGRLPLIGSLYYLYMPFVGRYSFDAVRYVTWLKNPDRKHIPIKDILALIRNSLPIRDRSHEILDTPAVIPAAPPPDPPPQEKRGRGRPRKNPPPPPDQPKRKPGRPRRARGIPDDDGHISLKNYCWPFLVNWWQGIQNRPGTLNMAIRTTAVVLWAEKIGRERAEHLLRDWIDRLPDHARLCSGRLTSGDLKAVHREVHRAVTKVWENGLSAQEERIMEHGINVWKQSGRSFSERDTWNMTPSNMFADIPDFEWNDIDRQAIEQVMGVVLEKEYRHLACDLAKGMARLVRWKQSTEDGISVGYWESFFADEYGIICGDDTREYLIRHAALTLGIIHVIGNPFTGRATKYAPGFRALKYLPRPDEEEVARESREHMAEVLLADPQLLASQTELDELAFVHYRLQTTLAQLQVNLLKMEYETAKARGEDLRAPKKALTKAENDLRSVQVEAEKRRLSVEQMQEAIATVQASE
jgi:hypothetical protein